MDKGTKILPKHLRLLPYPYRITLFTDYKHTPLPSLRETRPLGYNERYGADMEHGDHTLTLSLIIPPTPSTVHYPS